MRQTCFLAFILIVALCPIASAQDSYLIRERQEFLRINRQAMTVLGGWAAGNIVTSGVLISQHQGEERVFHAMNIGWNAVNMSIAAWGYFRTPVHVERETEELDVIRRQGRFRNILAFNTGLDIAYIVAGLYAWERGKTSEQNRALLRGAGKSLMLQGAFLLVFDAVQLGVQYRHGHRFLEGLQVGPNQVRWTWRF